MESEVWKHFSRCTKEAMATCKICKKKLSCKGSTTSSLIRHLESTHQLNIKKCKQDPTNVQVQLPGTSSQTLTLTIDKYLTNQSLEYILAKLVALDGFTIHAITNSSFIRDSLNRRNLYLPKYPAEVMKLVHKYYDVAKEQLICKIKMQTQDKKKFSLTLDEWTSKRNRRYLNVNIHDSTGGVYNLGLTRILGSCPAETALELLTNKLKSFNLSFADIIGCTTDGAAVMIKLGLMLPTSTTHQLCYNHAINLAVVDILYTTPIVSTNANISSESESEYSSENIITSDDEDSLENRNNSRYSKLPQLRENFSDTLARIRKIIKLFKGSPVKNNILHNYIKTNHGKELNLLLDCRTRWSLLCTMIERFLVVNSSVQKALVDLSLQHLFIGDDLRIIEQLINVLKPIKMAVEALSRRDANLLTSEGVLMFLFKTLEKENSHIAKEMLTALKHRISQRRNNEIISVMKFLQNPQSVKEKKL